MDDSEISELEPLSLALGSSLSSVSFNPKKLTAAQRDTLKLFRSFREREPSRAKILDIDIPDAVMVMGPIEFIGYRTSHGKKTVLYTHEFAPGSRPLLCAGPDDCQLVIVGGRYRVTERGIVDLDARGNEIDDGGGR